MFISVQYTMLIIQLIIVPAILILKDNFIIDGVIM